MKEYSNNYFAIHSRIKVAKGSATEYSCFICHGPAKSWACVGNKTHTMIRKDGKKVSYSIDLDDYQALCDYCHNKLDTGMDECQRGHNDWYINPQGRRKCRPCNTLGARERRKFKKTLDKK